MLPLVKNTSYRGKPRECCHVTLCFPEPVPQPKLLKSSDLNDCLIKLICLLPHGTVAAVSWKKDGHSLTSQNYYQLAQNFTELWVRNGEKSNCGSYSCNVSNAISWEEATFNLTITGKHQPVVGPVLCCMSRSCPQC